MHDDLPARPSGPRAPMAWAGWGDPARRAPLPRGAERLLRTALGDMGPRRPPVALRDVAVPPSRLSPRAVERLAEIVGTQHLATDRETRIRHAGGRSYPDLLRLRTGDAAHAPDAVLMPGHHEEIAAVLAACAEDGVAVVPFGGGTSVVGGVEPLRGGCSAVVVLDLRRMDRLLALDATSMTATFEPGLRGLEAEALLNARGWTLGHFPQSAEFATIGGFVATRSAGQASTGYGRIDDMVQRLRCATPSGDLDVGRQPASAAGPALLELLIGSEGVLGVLTEVTLAIRPLPAVRRYEGWAFPSFGAGLEAFRALAQHGPAPDVARLSDEEETRVALAQATGAKSVALRGLLGLRRRARGCLVIVGYEGTRRDVAHRRRRAAALLRRHEGAYLGRQVGRSWEHGRFQGAYLRDELMDRGVLVETLETAAPWPMLPSVHTRVREALQDALREGARPPVVLCHVSHLYATGASLYFTFLARARPGEELAQWRAAKDAAGAAIVGAGATITHHHAVGTDHLSYMEAEVGALGLAVLHAVKQELDPLGVLNPGKLIPPRGDEAGRRMG